LQSGTVLNANVFTTIGASRKLHDPIVDLRSPVSLVHSVDGIDWTFELNVVPDSSRAESARVSTVIKRDGVVMGSPIIVVGYGEPGVVRISDSVGTTIYEMEIRVDASDAPAVSMEIKFGPADPAAERMEAGVRRLMAKVERNAQGTATALLIPKNGLDANDPVLAMQLMQQAVEFQRFEEGSKVKTKYFGIQLQAHGTQAATSPPGYMMGDRDLIDFGITTFGRSTKTGKISLGTKQLSVRDTFLAAASLADLRVTNPELLSSSQTMDFELDDVPAAALLSLIADASELPFKYSVLEGAITLSR